MNEMAPVGCVTCYVALNEILRPNRPMGYFPLQWEAAFDIASGTKKVDDLQNGDGVRMIRAATELRQQLIRGDRIACYVGPNDTLVDLGSLAFAHDGTEERLMRQRVLYHGVDTEIFIRGEGYAVGKCNSKSGASAESLSEPKKPGRKNTTRDAALIYWGMFPEGHGNAGTSWDRAEDLVNGQLTKLGLKTVARNQFRKAVNEVGHVDPVKGLPKAQE